jgi:hypothetical protein
MASRAGYAAALLIAAALVSGCSDQEKLRRAELVQIMQQLPGRYDNHEQVQEDRRSGREPHDARILAIVRVEADELGRHVLYAQEMTDDAYHRITAQRVLSFDISSDKDKHIVQSIYSLTDPPRWRQGDSSPELFAGLQPPDVRVARGCELKWKKDAERFTAANDPKQCHTTSAGTSGSLSVEARAELTGETLDIVDRGFDSHGKLVYGREDDPFMRFRKQSAN